MPKQIEISCPDSRMNGVRDRDTKNNMTLGIGTIHLIMVGADARRGKNQILDTLEKHPDVVSIMIRTHGDCKYRTARFESLAKTGKDLDPVLMTPYDVKFAGLAQFEEHDNQAILTYVKTLVSGRERKYDIQLEQVPIEELTKLPEGVRIPHVLRVGRPEGMSYGDLPMGVYTLTTTRGLDEVMGQIKFFLERNMIEEVKFVAESEHARDARTDAARLRLNLMSLTPKMANQIRIGVELRT